MKPASNKTVITCLCRFEVDADEYEALTIVDEMLKKKLPISEKITLIIDETITTTTYGCGVRYR
jgi:hypothetical protein